MMNHLIGIPMCLHVFCKLTCPQCEQRFWKFIIGISYMEIFIMKKYIMEIFNQGFLWKFQSKGNFERKF